MKTLSLLAVAAVFLFAGSVKADGLDAYILTQRITADEVCSAPGVCINEPFSFTYWSFITVSQPNNDPYPFSEADIPFTIQEQQYGGIFTYTPAYTIGAFGSGPNEVTTFQFLPLTDSNNFIAGLPFECTVNCGNFISVTPGIASDQLNWLDNNLPSSSPVPESGTLPLVITGLAGLGLLKRRFSLLPNR